jgi:Tol biopolymer transport system component
VIVSILESEPGPLAQSLEAPAELQRILQKILRKNRDERYQTARDLALDLNSLKRELDVEARLKQVWQVKTIPGEPAKKSTPPGDTSEESVVRTTRFARAPTTSSVEYVITEIRKHKRGVALASGALMLLLAGVSYWLYGLLRQPRIAAVPFQRTKVTRLTTTGNVRDVAISPDGKYVAYVEDVGSRQSLWIRQLATGINLLVNPAADVYYFGLTFSTDSNYIYFVINEKGDFRKLYRVPALGGGAAKKLLDLIDSAVTFSPDGKRFAFMRDYTDQEETQLIVANADGSNERTLTTRKAPDFFVSGGLSVRMAWSPDGKVIACPGGTRDANGDYYEIIGVWVEDGSQRSLSNKRWQRVFQVTGNHSGFVILGAEKEESSPSFYVQLWHMSYPGGQVQRITNDTTIYQSVSLAVDSQTLVTTQKQLLSNIWLSSKGDTSRAKQLTSGIRDGLGGFAWTPAGKIAYVSRASGNSEIWMMDADGSNQRQLTNEGSNTDPQVSSDGLQIFFVSYRGGKNNIWRMDVNGDNEKQLSNIEDNQTLYPQPLYLSPDGRWVFYYLVESAWKVSLWKVPVDGGPAVSVTAVPKSATSPPAISPDGKQFAVRYWDEKVNPSEGLMIVPIEGGPPTKRFKIYFDQERGPLLRWAPDGSALLYIDERGANIWRHPINGGAPTQVTDFQGDQVFDFAYSRDGNWLAIARGRFSGDVLMITDLN